MSLALMCAAVEDIGLSLPLRPFQKKSRAGSFETAISSCSPREEQRNLIRNAFCQKRPPPRLFFTRVRRERYGNWFLLFIASNILILCMANVPLAKAKFPSGAHPIDNFRTMNSRPPKVRICIPSRASVAYENKVYRDTEVAVAWGACFLWNNCSA